MELQERFSLDPISDREYQHSLIEAATRAMDLYETLALSEVPSEDRRIPLHNADGLLFRHLPSYHYFPDARNARLRFISLIMDDNPEAIEEREAWLLNFN
ncbi:hypothetical protein GF386_04185 [Candidatus Pacearchaeota archaeon]|nr:hypothetical protein [Candidatus Pacearchaeota archaeon]